MLSANGLVLSYDSANRLLSAGTNTYTYDIENKRVKNLCNGIETVYTYNTNAELSQLLMKAVGESVTKYVYGVGLIGEESNNSFKTYHFDYRGSTVAITDSTGAVTDTFSYDSYGNLLSRTGTTDTPFMYNGEYGVVTDNNGLLYMRARYYSPVLRRFVNADVLMGDINNSATLNRYAYANGNPVSNVDPFGMSAERGNNSNPDQTSNNNYLVNYAFYVVDYHHQYGLPVVGHTRIYFLDSNGELWQTEFTGDFPDKSSAKVYLVNGETSYNSFVDDVVRLTEPLKYFEGTDIAVLKGDFSNSLETAKEYYKNQNYPDYNLILNSCLTYTKELLDEAKVDDWATNLFLKTDFAHVVPRTHIEELKNAQSTGLLINETIDYMEKTFERFQNFSIDFKQYIL